MYICELIVSYNKATKIIVKIHDIHEETMYFVTGLIIQYGLYTSIRCFNIKYNFYTLNLYYIKCIYYILKNIINKRLETINAYLSMISQTNAEYVGEPSSDGNFRVLTKSMKIMKKKRSMHTIIYLFANLMIVKKHKILLIIFVINSLYF